jgi:membrane dipeptidase
MRLFDAHCDTLSLGLQEVYDFAVKAGFTSEPLPKVSDVPVLTQSDVTVDYEGVFDPHCRVYAIWGPPGVGYQSVFEPLLVKYTEQILPLAPRVTPLLSVEGAHVLDCSLERLDEAVAQGVRLLNLTWNNANILSGSCAEESERGLSAQGRAYVLACERLGVLVDVSHLSDAGFWDLARSASKPIVASHSNARALHPHARNLTDEQFVAIARSGGVVGINLHADFVGGRDIPALLRHILHFLALEGGEHAVGIGTDYDGGITAIEGLEKVGGLKALYDALLAVGLGEDLVDAIFYRNWARLLHKI